MVGTHEELGYTLTMGAIAEVSIEDYLRFDRRFRIVATELHG